MFNVAAVACKKRTIGGSIDSLFYVLLFAIFLVMPYIAVLRYGLPFLVIGDTSATALSKDVFVLLFIFVGVIAVLFKPVRFRIDIFELSLLVLVLYSVLRVFVTSTSLINSIAAFRHEFIFTIFALILYRLCATRVILGDRVDYLFSFALVINLFVIAAIGYVEIFDKSVLVFLYGDKSSSLVLGIPGIPDIRTVSTLENPINLALFLTLALLYLSQSHFGRRRPVFVFAISILLLPLVISTLSRFFIFIYVFVFLGLGFQLFLKIDLSRKLVLLSSIIVVLFLLACGMGDGYFSEVTVDVFERRMDQTFSLFEDMDDPRFRNWRLAISEVQSIPVLGELMGLGLGVSNPGDFSPGQYRIENSFLTIFVQFGFIGFVIFFFPFFVEYVRYGFSRGSVGLFVNKYICIIFVILLGGVGNDTHRNMPFSMYLWVSLAMVAIYIRFGAIDAVCD